MQDRIPDSIQIDAHASYFSHEQWFELARIVTVRRSETLETRIRGLRLINSYGRMREVFEDGTYHDLHTGTQRQPTDDLVEEVPVKI